PLAVSSGHRGPLFEVFANLIGRPEGNPTLHDVLELADVAGPLVAAEHGRHVRRQCGRWTVELAGKPLEEAADEWNDLLRTLPEGWHIDGRDGQALVEVSTEPPARDEGV